MLYCQIERLNGFNREGKKMAEIEQQHERAARLARERALYQYTSALERGDFETVAAVLHQAETDGALERLILDVNEIYRAELLAEPTPARGDDCFRQGAGWLAAWKRRRGGTVADTNNSSMGGPQRRGRRFAPGLVAGAVVAAVVVTCLGAVLLAALLRGSNLASVGSDGEYGYAPPAPGLPQVVETVVVEREVIVESEEAAPWEAEDTASSAGHRLAASADLPEERLIIRTGNLALRVEDTLAAQQAIEDLVARQASEGAYVVSSEQRGGDDGEDPYISMAVRVPAARFGQTMDAIADLAVDVEARTETADDVTEEYVDLAARLEALQAARDRLLEIMSEANRTEDLLAAEEQLTRREAEIEAIQGRMQYLSQSAALARISVELQPYLLSQPVGERWRPAETAREALEALLDGAQGLVDFALFFSIAVLPWLLALALGGYLLYRLVRWAMRRRQARQATADTSSQQ